MGKLILEKETYDILGSCFNVHNHFGNGFLEVIYKDAIELEFEKQNIPFTRELEFPVFYNDIKLKHSFFADFIVHNEVMLEVKSVSALADAHRAQSMNYLKVSGIKIALLVNFGQQRLEYQRLII